jgi:ubiquinone/menaquinone biosynthesis C-methylase UbiE
MVDQDRLFQIFLDVQSGLPRQGPGCRESTLKALAICHSICRPQLILDIGCGPGMQTVDLANIVDGRFVALDTGAEYLVQLAERSEEAGVSNRVERVIADMAALPFPTSTFDLIWAEGSAYIMGVENALTYWKAFLKPSGCIAFSELVWLTPNPDADVREFFGDEYPAMKTIDGVLAGICETSLEVIAHFTLPDPAWWDHYYTPLKSKLPALFAKYQGDQDALAVIETTKREIETRERFASDYGYTFFVVRNTPQ